MVFKVAVLQMHSLNRQYDKNIKAIIEQMTRAKRNGAFVL